MKNQVALITGASSGIGEALALEFASRGADTAILARRVDRLEELKNKIEKGGTQALSLPADVTDKKSLEEAVHLTLARWGRIDYVVANAGYAVGGNFENLDIEDYRRQFETNFFGALHTASATLGALKKTQGSICFIGSVNSWISVPSAGAYVSSKFALRGFTESLYYEMIKYGVSVTHISPGFVATEIRTVDNHGRLNDKLKEDVPAWLMMPPQKAARQIVRAIVKRCPEQIITGHGKLGVFLIRHFPWLVRSILRRMVSKLQWRSGENPR